MRIPSFLIFHLSFGDKIVQEKAKKTWIVVDARTLRKEDIQKETVYCLNDDDETEVSKEDTIQGMLVRACTFT
jgi:ATP-dependent DNA helicase 2 subunit 2